MFRASSSRGVNRRALRHLAGGYFFHFGAVGVLVPFASMALITGGFSPAVVGSMWALRSAIQVASPSVWGMLADRAGRGRPFAAASLLFAALACLGLAVTTDVTAGYLLFAAYGLLGASAPSLIDGMVLSSLGHLRRRYGRIRLYGGLGFGVTALASSLLIEVSEVTARAIVVFPAAAGLLVLGALSVITGPDVKRPRMGAMGEVWTQARAPTVLLLAALCIAHWASHGAYSAFILPLAAARGIPTIAVGVGLALSIAAEITTMRFGAAAVARFGAYPLLVGITALTALRWAGLAVIEQPAAFAAMQLLHGISFGLFFPVVVTLIAEHFGRRARQTAQGLLVSVFFGVGGSVGMWTAGSVLEHAGAPATWWAMSGLSVSSLVLAAALWSTQRGATLRRGP